MKQFKYHARNLKRYFFLLISLKYNLCGKLCGVPPKLYRAREHLLAPILIERPWPTKEECLKIRKRSNTPE